MLELSSSSQNIYGIGNKKLVLSKENSTVSVRKLLESAGKIASFFFLIFLFFLVPNLNAEQDVLVGKPCIPDIGTIISTLKMFHINKILFMLINSDFGGTPKSTIIKYQTLKNFVFY